MPQIKRYCLTYFSVLLFLLIGCSTDTDIEDSFIQELKTELKEKPAEWIIHPGTEYLYEANFLTSSDGCEYITAVDRATSKIFLFNEAGDLLDEAGGEGDGPDEFRGIVSIHISYDNKLYLVDGVLNRVSIYSISEGYLEYLTSMAYENQPEYFLNSVYVTEYGNYGVYQHSEGFFSPESKFYLYRLDENFEPIDRLIEMPGNERFESQTGGQTMYTPHQLLGKTIWDVDDKWFFYNHTITSEIKKVNLLTGEKETLRPVENQERSSSTLFVSQAEEYYPVEEDEEYWSVLYDLERLPLYTQLTGENGVLIVKALANPGEDGIGIYYNYESGEGYHFSTPEQFSPSIICGETVYGIDFNQTEEYRITTIEFSDETGI